MPSRQFTKAIEIAGKAQKQDEYTLSQSTAAPAGGEASPAKAEAEAAIAAAEAARTKAASVGGEWRDTGKMIKDAEAAMKSGEFDQAIKLATQAKNQGELGYAQSLHETDAGFPSYMHPKQ
jgi:regulator of protease activity HflC (stomatin/prohibitin superfamily)